MATRTDLKIPYGIADFKRIRNEGWYYVDKTEYLAKLEERDSFVFFVRPRRFGKSLFFDWYDGCSEPDQLAPAWSRPPAEIEALFAKTPYGRRGHEGKAIRCRDGWILALHRSEKGIFVVRNDGTVAGGPEVGPAPTHFHEFIDRCRDGRRAAADFAWSTHMMELILTGTVAERLPGRKLVWNRAAQAFDDPAANAYLGSAYRDGWRLDGLS